jgi:acyl carrier protein
MEYPCMERSLFLQHLASEYGRRHIAVTENSTFRELGMGPYDVMDFMLRVEEEYGIVIDDARLLSMNSIADVLDTIAECTQMHNKEE